MSTGPPIGKHWENKHDGPVALTGCCPGRRSVFLTGCNRVPASSRLKLFILFIYLEVAVYVAVRLRVKIVLGAANRRTMWTSLGVFEEITVKTKA